MRARSSLPIGFFDSGVGGLTVLKAVGERLPCENLLYLGDTARVPYGIKSPETIIRYTMQAAGKLASYGVKMLVIACNTATSAALPFLEEHFAPIPVLGVVEPGAEAAAEATKNGTIAVIATEATIKEGAYQKAIGHRLPSARVIARACPLFVSLAEEGWLDGPIAEGVAERYLGDIFGGGDKPDTLLLGCTHFPLFTDILQKAVGKDVRIVDSARAAARHVGAELARRGLQNDTASPQVRFLTTDNRERFIRAGSLFWGHTLSNANVDLVDL